MKVALLYIGIGKYSCFWDGFYSSCERYFLPGAEKHYFFVSDSKQSKGENVTTIYQQDLGWPCNTWHRFMFFLRCKEQLKEFDYIFFCNGNTQFKKPVTAEEIIPTTGEGGLTMLTWQPEDVDFDTQPFERRGKSAACVPLGTRQFYYQGGLNGGSSKEYLELLEGCNAMTERDFRNGIVPVSHDESVLNSYMLNRKCKVLNSIYGCPEHRDKKKNAKIIFINKDKVLGRTFMKRYKNKAPSRNRLTKKIKKLFS